jgi:hypothetical protein
MSDPYWTSNDRDRYLRLATLAADASTAPMWQPTDVQPVWARQLDANVVKCLEELGPVHALHAQTLCESVSPHIESLRDLFSRSTPNLELLTLVGRWMERELGDPEELLPRDVSVALFNIAIVLARLRCNARLINGTDTELARRADWVASRVWIDPQSALLMRQATIELGGLASQDSQANR